MALFVSKTVRGQKYRYNTLHCIMQVVSAMVPRAQIAKQPAFVWRKPRIFTSQPGPKLSVVTFPLATFHLTTVALRNRRSSLARQQSRESEDCVAVKQRQIFKDVEFPENLSGRQKIEYALWGAWRKLGNPKPPSKEIKECLAFFNGCSRELGHKKLLVDAAGLDSFKPSRFGELCNCIVKVGTFSFVVWMCCLGIHGFW